jgi:hypothetical protein
VRLTVGFMKVWHKAAPAGLAPNLSFILQLLLHLRNQKPLLRSSLLLFDAKFGIYYGRLVVAAMHNALAATHGPATTTHHQVKHFALDG